MRLILCTIMASLLATAAVAQAPAPGMPAAHPSEATTRQGHDHGDLKRRAGA